jgi:hypothetical protein
MTVPPVEITHPEDVPPDLSIVDIVTAFVANERFALHGFPGGVVPLDRAVYARTALAYAAAARSRLLDRFPSLVTLVLRSGGGFALAEAASDLSRAQLATELVRWVHGGRDVEAITDADHAAVLRLIAEEFNRD